MDTIERVFGVLCCTAGGLGALPPWVRTLDRVRRWVGAKIVLYKRQTRGPRSPPGSGPGVSIT